MENDVVWNKKKRTRTLFTLCRRFPLSARFSSGGLSSLSLPFSSVPAQGTELCVPYKLLHCYKNEMIDLYRALLLVCESSQVFDTLIACMLRLFQTCKGGRFTRNLQSVALVLREFSAPANALQDYRKDRGTDDVHMLFRQCTKLHSAKCLHARLIVSQAIQNVCVSAKLVNLYCYLGSLALARHAFDSIQNKDVYAWNAMVSGYVRLGSSSEAIKCFSLFMMTSGLQPDYRTFPSVLKACRSLLDGMKIHCSALKYGFVWDVFVAASLVHLYCRYGPVANARRLFDEMPVRDMGSWNAMISGYCQSGNAEEALALSKELKVMDAVTIVSLLAACTEAGDFVRGVLIHLYSIKHGLDSELYVSNKLIDMYAESGNLKGCQKVFDEMVVRDLITWNSMIKAYEVNEQPLRALRLFEEMQFNRIQPDCLTLISLASTLAQLGDVRGGRSVQGFTLRKGWILEDVTVGNTVVDMYAKLGLVDSARAVFDYLSNKDVISWNTIISGYAQNGFATEAIEMYNEMEEEEGGEINPNQGTWVSVLPACSQSGALRQGMKIHGRLLKNGLCSDVFIGTSLADMYGKCGRLEDALSLFYQIPRVNSVPWNTLIACHGLHGHGEKAMMLFREMLDEGVKPDHITFVTLLSACSHSGLELRSLHEKVKMIGYVPDHRFVLQDVEDDEKEHILMSHSERLAIAFALVTTPPKTRIQIFKNLRVCSDCHSVTKFMSRITEREIVSILNLVLVALDLLELVLAVIQYKTSPYEARRRKACYASSYGVELRYMV
ncbi:hypothetical protein HID58_045694 [Brassica napus]|uniref:DYW domain-containing protein n=1 Tax=Brassica napus TaxID=3708 RepID=A0ABQ8AUA1_BRANA|nr:hypothetical protein HID58_045694 [Brassica napus]